MRHFPEPVIKGINGVFENALAEGRNTLYEYEVYQVLKWIGLEAPRFVLVKSPELVNDQILRGLGPNLVLKIVSAQIAHKQVLGGVKKVPNGDPLYIQFVLAKMRQEVLGHFHPDEQPEIAGFLVVEFIPHTQALGYEELIGIKEDPAFGPVLTLSKGGDDAEFFAKYYDPANLFLPPLDAAEALKMVQTLNIRHKFEGIGHPEYSEFIAKAVSRLGYLAYDYSFAAEQQQEFIIKALDINPFVITEDNRLVAIDGFAQFERNRAVNRGGPVIGVPEVNLTNLEGFFRPQGIAVVGVSSDLNKYSLGREIAKLLHDMHRKDLFLINAKGGVITFGETEYPLYQKLSDLPGRVELVVYAAPAQSTLDFFKDLPKPYPKAVILISGIPAEVKYADFTRRLNEVVPPGVRVIGPNCMGVYWAPDEEGNGLNTLFVEEKRLELKNSNYSNTVLLTQSGAFSVTAIDKLQNNSLFKAIVSFGNKYDVKITDLLAYFNSLPGIDILALYIEGLDPGEGRKLFQLAGEINKPVIVYKSGKTEAGARAAASHTASISGSYDVFKAACRQSGIILAEKIEDHYDYVKVFSQLAKKIPAGNRVAGVVNAGFESTVGADELKNLKQAQLTPETVERLNRINKHGLVDISTPFLDVTPMADDRMYADFVETILQDQNVDCVFVAIVPHSVTLKTIPGLCQEPDSLANLLVELNRKYTKPIVISVNAGRYYQEFISIMEQNGLPVYTDIRSAIKSLDRFVTYHVLKNG
ncbi:MAG: acetate--CoA ligase family protein [Bacillota bacterium]